MLPGEAYRAWDSRCVSIVHDDRLRWMTRDPDFDSAVSWPDRCQAEAFGCVRLGGERRETSWAWNR